jgi:HSP20 family protein
VRQERYEGEMTRTIVLPTQIQPEKVQASYENGVLKLEIPKSEAAMPKQIEVKTKEATGTS